MSKKQEGLCFCSVWSDPKPIEVSGKGLECTSEVFTLCSAPYLTKKMLSVPKSYSLRRSRKRDGARKPKRRGVLLMFSLALVGDVEEVSFHGALECREWEIDAGIRGAA